MKNKELARTIKFVLFSASAGLIEIGSFALLYDVLKLPYTPSYLVALVLSVLWNFTFNKKFTFKSAANVPKAMALVFAFYIFFTPLSTWLGNWLEGGLGWDGNLVTLLNMVLNLILEYLWDNFLVYRDSKDTNDIAQKQEASEDAPAEEQ